MYASKLYLAENKLVCPICSGLQLTECNPVTLLRLDRCLTWKKSKLTACRNITTQASIIIIYNIPAQWVQLNWHSKINHYPLFNCSQFDYNSNNGLEEYTFLGIELNKITHKYIERLDKHSFISTNSGKSYARHATWSTSVWKSKPLTTQFVKLQVVSFLLSYFHFFFMWISSTPGLVLRSCGTWRNFCTSYNHKIW